MGSFMMLYGRGPGVWEGEVSTNWPRRLTVVFYLGRNGYTSVTELRIEVTTGGFDGETPDDGPARLARAGAGVGLSTESYPTLTVPVRIDANESRYPTATSETFQIEEGRRKRPVTGVERIDSPLDLAFVFDDTGSMSAEIDGAKAGVRDLAERIHDRGIDARYALVTFKDDVEVDTPFTTDVTRLDSDVAALEAAAGGDVPEANFDAVHRALNLNWRADARRVVIDITDAPSHYAGDGSGFSSYTFDDVTAALRETETTFIAVAPDLDDEQRSVKTLAEAANGLWADVAAVRDGSFGDENPSQSFVAVLERITELVADRCEVTYESAATPGERTPVTVRLDSPGFDTARAETFVSPPADAEPRSDAGSADEPTMPATTPDVALMLQRDRAPAGGEVVVTVRDETGDRVAGATVTGGNEPVETDDRGRCRVPLASTGETTLVATLGDAEATATITVTDEGQR